MDNIVLNLTLTEFLAIIGMIQSIYLLVHIFLRSNNVLRATLPVLFFLTIFSTFFIIVLKKMWGLNDDLYIKINWLLWALCYPLSSLLAIQIARITQPPQLKLWFIFLLIPVSYLFSYLLYKHYEIDILDSLIVAGVVIGALSLLLVWIKRDTLDKLHKRQNGKERFWLIMSLILLNVALLSFNFVFLNSRQDYDSLEIARILIGLSFIYVISTSLFRIYPPSITRHKNENVKSNDLSDAEIEIALEIENLLNIQKVYQESSYGRSNMAKELNISEAQLSRIVNEYFKKNVPLLLNSLRVEEAKTLLVQTDIDIAAISEEAGFNSIATFNRVFKDLLSVSPKEYREKNK